MPIIITFIKGFLPSTDEMDFCTRAPQQWVVSSLLLLVYIQKAEKILYLPLHHQEPSECHCIMRIQTCNWWRIWRRFTARMSVCVWDDLEHVCDLSCQIISNPIRIVVAVSCTDWGEVKMMMIIYFYLFKFGVTLWTHRFVQSNMENVWFTSCFYGFMCRPDDWEERSSSGACGPTRWSESTVFYIHMWCLIAVLPSLTFLLQYISFYLKKISFTRASLVIQGGAEEQIIISSGSSYYFIMFLMTKFSQEVARKLTELMQGCSGVCFD